MVINVKGIVVKADTAGENDKYITILTERYGKIFFRARGVRKINSKNIGAVQLFSYSDFSLIKRDNFTAMSEASLIEGFPAISIDLTAFSLAAYICDIASAVSLAENITSDSDTYDGDDGVTKLLLYTLYHINAGRKDIRILKSVFELRILTLTGFMPDLSGCSCCGGRNVKSNAFFDTLGGGYTCEGCPHTEVYPNGRNFIVKIDRDVLSAMRYIITAADEKIFSFNLHGEDLISQLAEVCGGFTELQLNLSPPSLKSYKLYIRDYIVQKRKEEENKNNGSQ